MNIRTPVREAVRLRIWISKFHLTTVYPYLVLLGHLCAQLWPTFEDLD